MRLDGPEGAALLASFEEVGDRRRYPEGAALFLEGDPPGTVFAILEGDVQVSATGPDGEDLVLNVCGAGELLGEVSAIDGLPRSASAVAVGGPVEVLAVPSGRFNRLLESTPALALQVLRLLAGRLRTATDERVLHRRGDAMTAVAAAIVDFADTQGEPVGAIVRIRASRRELAEWTGGDREVLSRVLAGLAGEGWIELTDDGLDVINLVSLRSLAADADGAVLGV
jgi:CRP/FNR family transcriptional regulator, cyclic AMP receptor protein